MEKQQNTTETQKTYRNLFRSNKKSFILVFGFINLFVINTSYGDWLNPSIIFFLVVFNAIVFRFFRQSVTVNPDSVSVKGFFKTTTIRWSDVSHIEKIRTGSLALATYNNKYYSIFPATYLKWMYNSIYVDTDDPRNQQVFNEFKAYLEKYGKKPEKTQ